LCKEKVNYQACLIGVILVNYVISLLGFDGIMKIAVPILLVFYPALIALVICNWLHKTTGLSWVKMPVYLTAFIALAHLMIPTSWY
jgi:branched-subunit amino acid permease